MTVVWGVSSQTFWKQQSWKGWGKDWALVTPGDRRKAPIAAVFVSTCSPMCVIIMKRLGGGGYFSSSRSSSTPNKYQIDWEGKDGCHQHFIESRVSLYWLISLKGSKIRENPWTNDIAISSWLFINRCHWLFIELWDGSLFIDIFLRGIVKDLEIRRNGHTVPWHWKVLQI